MQQWLFVSSSGQQFTANEPDVPALIQSGQIGAQTLMWREGMPQWMPAASLFPLLFTATGSAATQPMVPGRSTAVESPAAPASGPAPVTRATAGYAGNVAGESMVRRFAGPLYERQGWIKLLGIMMIIGGIFSIPALGLGLLSLFSGLALMKVARAAERAYKSGDASALEEAQRNTAKSFFLSGLLVAIQLCLSVVVIGLMLLTSGAAIFSGIKGRQNNGVEIDGGHGGPTIDDIQLPDRAPSRGGQ